MYILRPHAAGILYAPPVLYTPPTPRRVFSGVGGWGCIKFGPVLKISSAVLKGRDGYQMLAPVLVILSGNSLACSRKMIASTVLFRGEQRAPQNATYPKTQVMDRFENPHFRVCCVFGCSLFPSKGGAKTHPKTRHTPEHAASRNGPSPAFSGVLRFRVCFRGPI